MGIYKCFLVFLLFLAAAPSWGGAFVDDPLPLISKIEPAPKIIEKIIERQIVMKEAKDIKSIYGLTLGFVSDYFLLGYSTPDLFIEAGVKNVNGDNSAMILAGGIAQPPSWLTLAKFTRPRIGIALNPGLTGRPSVGLFAGLEKSIDERLIGFADVYYWFGNNCFAYPTVSAGAKITI